MSNRFNSGLFNLLFSAIFVLLMADGIQAQCEIFDMTVVTECYPNAPLFDAEINFLYANVSDSFKVQGNGNNYGFFAYSDLPITLIGLEANCSTPYEFVAIDKVDTDCSDFVDVGQVCCSACEITDLVLTTGPCVNDHLFELTMDFNISGNTNDFFDWEVVGIDSGFELFNNLPLTVALENTTIEILTVVICENDNPNCCIEGTIANPCFAGGTCEIFDMTVLTECYTNGDFFDAEIDFQYANTSDSFKIVGNGLNYGHFAYTDLPVTLIGLDADCTTAYEFVAVDLDDNQCSDFVDVGLICCGDCEIAIVDFDASDCIDSQFVSITFSLDTAATSGLGFDVFDANGFVAYFTYDQLPVTISDFDAPSDHAVLILQVCDNDDPNCCDVLEFENPCYIAAACEIWDLTVTTECLPDSTLFDAEIHFLYTNVSDSFMILGNGNNYGTFAYADLPVTLHELEANCTTNYEFVIVDADHPNCAEDIGIGSVCCGNNACEIWDLTVTTECLPDSTLFDAEINFLYANVSDSFMILGNGNNYGTFAYADLPVTLHGLEANCSTNYEFVVVDMDNPNCAEDIGIGPVCCGNNACELTNLILTTGPCINDHLFELTIDFDFTGNTNDYFDWEVVGIDSGFDLFNNLPLTISLENTTIETLEVIICENDNPNCCISGTIANPCYEPPSACVIDSLVATVMACDSGLFDISIDFFFENVSDSFTLAGNGVFYGVFAYSDLPVLLTDLDADCTTVYEFVATDSADANCSDFEDVGIFCCNNFNRVVHVDAVATDVTAGIFYLSLAIEHTLLPGCVFEVYIDGVLVDEVSFDEHTILLGPLECAPDKIYEISIVSSCNPEGGTSFTLTADDTGCITSVSEASSGFEVTYDFAATVLRVENNSAQPLMLTLFDVQGRKILARSLQDQISEVNFSSVRPGFYLVRLVSMENGALLTRKITIGK